MTQRTNLTEPAAPEPAATSNKATHTDSPPISAAKAPSTDDFDSDWFSESAAEPATSATAKTHSALSKTPEAAANIATHSEKAGGSTSTAASHPGAFHAALGGAVGTAAFVGRLDIDAAWLRSHKLRATPLCTSGSRNIKSKCRHDISRHTWEQDGCRSVAFNGGN